MEKRNFSDDELIALANYWIDGLSSGEDMEFRPNKVLFPNAGRMALTDADKEFLGSIGCKFLDMGFDGDIFELIKI